MLNRVATTTLQLGLIAVVLVALPFKLFELDRYFVPKELVLHITALLLGLMLAFKLETPRIGRLNMLLMLFIAWSFASALFATNHWVAQRGFAVSLSSVIVFLAARQLAAAGWRRHILLAVAGATVAAALTSLAQTYGVDIVYFSLNRAPGGTFGNRNFVAHICAIGLPSIVVAAAAARTTAGMTAGSVALALVAGALVLTRSRGAWLAVGVSCVVMMLALVLARKRFRDAGVARRMGQLVAAAVIGAVMAMAIPNRLNWRSDSPYLDSARAMVDYSSGSGRGRVAQYLNSLKMSVAHPLFGVGPGNWPVQYVRYAPPNDRSLADDGMTANPWPSSDWAAFLSERGFIATGALLGVFVLLFLGSMRGWATLDGEGMLARVAALGTITAVSVVSAFDAVLLLAAPAMIAWSAIGAMAAAPSPAPEVGTSPRRFPAYAIVAVWLLLATSVARSVTQTIAITTVGTGGRRAGWISAAAWDPGSYRINARVAELYANQRKCSLAGAFGHRALGLFPYSAPAKRLARGC